MKKKILSLLVLLMAAVSGAWADELSESFTTNTKASVYTGNNFKITVDLIGDKDGFTLSEYKYATIEALNGETITKVEFTKGYYDINRFHCEVGTVTFSDDVATVSGVNQTSLTVTATQNLQIKAVKVYYTVKTFDYTFSVADCDHGSGTVKFFIDGKEVKGAMQADEGKTVTVTVTPDAGWIVDDTKVKAESYSTWEAAGAPSRRAPGNIQILGDVTLTKSTTAENTWTFTMPAASVLVSAAYIPVAAFAPAEPSGTLAPTAAEGVIAGEDKAIIVAGTVANIPETTNPQGTVKYFVTDNKDMTAEQAAKANGWVETLPTAAGYTGSYADDFQVYVWYYIQAATGYADSKPQRIEVTVQSNLFDLALKAANANTIDATQASKGTVSVKEGTGAAVDKTSAITDGKLKAIKMGSEVKMTAKQGYKFRKVEVKKTGSAVLAPALENGATVVIICDWGDATTTFTYTNNGGTFSGQVSGYEAGYFHNGLELNGKNLSFGASNVDNSEYLSVGITFNTESSAYSYTGKGEDFSSFTISVNGTDVTDQLSELK